MSDVGATLEAARAELNARCDAIERCYEFMLAYAAQGLAGDAGASSGAPLREFLGRADAALTGLAELYAALVRQDGLASPEKYDAFIAVLSRDASDAQAAIRLVLAQPSISSQLVDNLNASIHVRAMLTDLFLIDELIKERKT